MNNIGVIICYFGKWPDFFPFFLSSIIWNKDIHWLVFSDNDDVFSKYSNISFYKIDKTKFNRLASEKTNLNIKIIDPYKLCDFKPLYGKIFEDYLSNYKFWGYSDIDVIYGQISNFITAETLQGYDVISTYQEFLSGPFCLFRNSKQINKLHEQSVNFPGVFKTNKHFGFDENIQKGEITGISLYKVSKVILFTLQYLLAGKLLKSSWKEFRYQFQWFYKKDTIKADNLADMTEVVWFYNKHSKIKALFKGILISDKYFNRNKNPFWNLKWEDGVLIDQSTGKQLFGFHFIRGKNNSDFNLNHNSIPNNKIIITEQGIY